MTEPHFFKPDRTLTVAEIVTLTGAKAPEGVPVGRAISGVSTLDAAGPSDLAFLENVKYADDLPGTRAGVCLMAPRFAAKAPKSLIVLETREPYRAFVAVTRALYPGALRPSSLFEAQGIAPGAFVHSSARLEQGVIVDPGAVIGPRAEIGAGSVICPGAVIGPDVRIGRNTSIGANATVTNALIGDHVIIHPGCCIGQDGFGFNMSPRGHQKIPQIGRVIIQDHVEIGAATSIDRGAIRDTVIGEGTKIDNQVQIAHNVSIGRHCVIVAQNGIAGSTTIGDYAVLGARAGANTHTVIGEGAQLAGASLAHGIVPPGARYGGVPARPAKQWFREMKAIQRLGRKTVGSGGEDTDTAGGE